MEDGTIALKIDVDTHQGMKVGVPNLLRILRDFGARATFFLSFGPDNSGKAVWNILRRRGFLSKMIRTGAPRLYGMRTLLYGTLLPAPKIAVAFPEVVRRIDREGHEIGVHAWDHRLWQDHLDRLSREEIRQEFARSFRAYREILGRDARAAAAPAWYSNGVSLAVQDDFGLDYASDARGEHPFYPRVGRRVFQTLQIPTNQPCMEEVIGRRGINPGNVAEYMISRLKQEYPNVVPVHAEVEGGLYGKAFAEFLSRTVRLGCRFVGLDEICRRAKKGEVPVREIEYRELPGRSGLAMVPRE